MHCKLQNIASCDIVFTLLLSKIVIDVGGLYEGRENIEFKVYNPINVRLHGSKKDKHIDKQHPVYKTHSLINSKRAV